MLSRMQCTALNKTVLLKSYRQRIRDSVHSIRENFTEIIRLSKVEEESQVMRLTNYEEKQFELQIRTANMTRCAESLIKLVSDLKKFLILNDFEFVSESVEFTNNQCQLVRKQLNEKLLQIKEEAAILTFDAENEYYNSVLRNRHTFLT